MRYARTFRRNCSNSLIKFLQDIPPAQHYLSDGAPMYGQVLGTKVLQKKNAMTNLVESFNAQVRQYLPPIRRKTKAFSKNLPALQERLSLLLVVKGWLSLKRPARKKKKNLA